MTNITMVKKFCGIEHYTGAYPPIKAQYRKGGRPKEFGNKIWATSFVFMDYLIKKPFNLKGLRVLEIGCGWGLLGVFLAKNYSCKVTCSDFDECVLPVVKLQAQLNKVSIDIKKSSFNDLSVDFLKNFDLIVGAEVCYSSEACSSLLQMVDRAFVAGVSKLVIADPGRPDFNEYCRYCEKKYPSDLEFIAGTVNGKTTKVFSISFLRL